MTTDSKHTPIDAESVMSIFNMSTEQYELMTDTALEAITELLAENERLRSALEHLAQDAEAMGIEGSAYSGSLIEAHAALKGEV